MHHPPWVTRLICSALNTQCQAAAALLGNRPYPKARSPGNRGDAGAGTRLRSTSGDTPHTHGVDALTQLLLTEPTEGADAGHNANGAIPLATDGAVARSPQHNAQALRIGPENFAAVGVKQTLVYVSFRACLRT